MPSLRGVLLSGTVFRLLDDGALSAESGVFTGVVEGRGSYLSENNLRCVVSENVKSLRFITQRWREGSEMRVTQEPLGCVAMETREPRMEQERDMEHCTTNYFILFQFLRSFSIMILNEVF